MRSLGSRAFFDPSTDNRHFSDCVRCVFPAVFHVRRHTQILGVCRAESFLSCGYLPLSISLFLVSIHLLPGLHRPTRQADVSQKSLERLSCASLSPSGILLIHLHHASCHPSPSSSSLSFFDVYIIQNYNLVFASFMF